MALGATTKVALVTGAARGIGRAIALRQVGPHQNLPNLEEEKKPPPVVFRNLKLL